MQSAVNNRHCVVPTPADHMSAAAVSFGIFYTLVKIFWQHLSCKNCYKSHVTMFWYSRHLFRNWSDNFLFRFYFWHLAPLEIISSTYVCVYFCIRVIISQSAVTSVANRLCLSVFIFEVKFLIGWRKWNTLGSPNPKLKKVSLCTAAKLCFYNNL